MTARPDLPGGVVSAILLASGPPYALARLTCKDVRDDIDRGTERLSLKYAGDDDRKLFEFLTRLPNVKTATTRGSFDSLVALAGLKELHVQSTEVVDISPLADLVGLNELDMFNCTKLVNISPLVGLRDLELLNLCCTKVSDISPLAGLIGLKDLCLVATDVSDVSPLAGLVGLEKLELYETMVSGIQHFPSRLGHLTGPG